MKNDSIFKTETITSSPKKAYFNKEGKILFALQDVKAKFRKAREDQKRKHIGMKLSDVIVDIFETTA